MWNTVVLGTGADLHAAELARNLLAGKSKYPQELRLEADMSVGQRPYKRVARLF